MLGSRSRLCVGRSRARLCVVSSSAGRLSQNLNGVQRSKTRREKRTETERARASSATSSARAARGQVSPAPRSNRQAGKSANCPRWCDSACLLAQPLGVAAAGWGPKGAPITLLVYGRRTASQSRPRNAGAKTHPCAAWALELGGKTACPIGRRRDIGCFGGWALAMQYTRSSRIGRLGGLWVGQHERPCTGTGLRGDCRTELKTSARLITNY